MILALVLEHLLDRDMESSCYSKGQGQRWCVLAGFDGNDGLAGDAGAVG